MGKIIEALLEKIQEGTELTRDLLEIVLAGKSGYGREAARSFRYGPRGLKKNWADLYRKRQLFYSLLNKLKRDGLIVKKKKGNYTAWRITTKGARKLTAMHDPGRISGGIPMQSYIKDKSKEVTIISYDVPEKMRKKRHWLRSNLLALDFSPLQKSVWVGMTEIPEEFWVDLRAQDLIPYVHLFSVNKQGTIITRKDGWVTKPNSSIVKSGLVG